MPPISPDDWHRLEPCLDQLLDLPHNQRDAWLAGHQELSATDRQLLQELLAAHQSAAEELETPLAAAAGQLVVDSMDDPLIGQALGPYEVGEEIGRGGMGVVYLGRRNDGEFKQDVVIKVLRLGADTEDSRRRFIQERQILANLDHPGIVRLLDGGFTPDGRPYLVMNRIVGQRIDSYCDRKKLDIKARVRLFLAVVESVDHAHRHLVIHRDLKPSNVWVDNDGKAHLLDFGISKITAADDTAPALTITHQRLMTPEYASPEQIRSQDITTASDVYQLGVLLYQLLTGQYPYDLTDRTPRQMEDTICQTDPLPASRAVASPTAAAAVAAALNQAPDYIFTSRGSSVGQLKSVLRGDLELIVQKALRKEPQRRYHSAYELRQDLIRWLNGDRVLARPDSVSYQFQRFLRRHPLGVSLAATLVVCAVGFSIFHVKRITAERDIARLEATRRAEVSDFLVNLLKVPDPTASKGREITARELLVDSYAHIDEELSDPETKIRLLKVVGEVAFNLGLFDQAGPALAKVVDLSAEIYGRNSIETANAALHLSRLWREANMPDDAAKAAKTALQISCEMDPANDLLAGRSLREVALTHRDQRQYDLAETELREALPLLDAGLPAGAPLRTAIQCDLAYVLRTTGKTAESEALYRESIPVMRERIDEFQNFLPSALNNLAYLLRKQDKYAEAELLYREAITLNEGYYGDTHPQTLTFRNNLASVLQKQNKVEATRQQLAKIITLQKHLSGNEHWRTGVAHRSLGYFEYMCGNYTAAITELRTTLDIFQAGLGADNTWTAAAAVQLATCLHLVGKAEEAEQLWREANPVLTTEKARNDRNIQGTLRRTAEHLPDSAAAWRQKMDTLLTPTN